MIYLVIPSIILMPILSFSVPKNNTEFVKMSHAEVMDTRPIFTSPTPEMAPQEPVPPPGHIDHEDHHDDHIKPQKIMDLMQNHDDGNVLFVKDQSGRRAEDNRRLEDVLSSRRTIQELAEGKRRTTEPPPDDEEENIVFVSGKNHDTNEPQPARDFDRHEEARRDNVHIVEAQKKTATVKLDCKHLNCNNTVKSICAGRLDNNGWKYRLFLNECYFRKVNCAFKSESNRYKIMPRSACRGIAEHVARVQYSYMPPPPRNYYRQQDSEEDTKKFEDTRRQFYSRRATNKDINGFLCSHACPISCPDEYEPECAVSSTGNRKVFLNHCKLDYNSCSYGVVWHRRPLSECVGGKKADMRQNRGFIGWMQKVGLVDGKGRLTFE